MDSNLVQKLNRLNGGKNKALEHLTLINFASGQGNALRTILRWDLEEVSNYGLKTGVDDA